MTPLTKERTKELELTTVSYMMVLSYSRKNPDPIFVHEFHNWSDDCNGQVGDIFYKGLFEKVQYLSDKLSMKQTYYVNLGDRNAVWGIKYKENEYVLYFSNRGFSLQTDEGTPPDELLGFIKELIKIWKK